MKFFKLFLLFCLSVFFFGISDLSGAFGNENISVIAEIEENEQEVKDIWSNLDRSQKIFVCRNILLGAVSGAEIAQDRVAEFVASGFAPDPLKKRYNAMEIMKAGWIILSESDIEMEKIVIMTEKILETRQEDGTFPSLPETVLLVSLSRITKTGPGESKNE